ncbi:MAG: agmatine deiminase family protein [Sphingomonadaceae bacterium]|jgi:agmatine deiminase|uniref:agmatine deiminase family protein n=1 Tax=Sphingorhabdus sp. TaxID=1902408 RepID=UPI002FDB0CD6|nr:agmatine deiminase family protein [Sphingomonadaceae bacterium]
MAFRMPAEWAPHESVWIGFPSSADAWGAPLHHAQQQIAAFANAVHASGRGERIHLVAGSAEAAAIAVGLVESGVHVEQRLIGDIWLRDTACIVVKDSNHRIARNFGFNGWGGRFDYPGDKSIGQELAVAAGLEVATADWILEGGSIDVDGEGLAATTVDCLLNPNRNPMLDQYAIEARLRDDLGIQRLLWLGDGLANDHTDGHIDNLARFVGVNHILIPQGAGSDDPNEAVFEDARKRAEAFGCRVSRIPSVGRFLQDREIVPASYMNFYIGNAAIVVPLYGARNDDAAIATLASLFPDREVVGVMADAVLTGGGSFHCSSQQVPT